MRRDGRRVGRQVRVQRRSAAFVDPLLDRAKGAEIELLRDRSAEVLEPLPGEVVRGRAHGLFLHEKSGLRFCRNALKASLAAGSTSMRLKTEPSSSILCSTAVCCPLFISRLISTRLLMGLLASLAACACA